MDTLIHPLNLPLIPTSPTPHPPLSTIYLSPIPPDLPIPFVFYEQVLAELKSVFDRFAVDGLLTPPESCQALTEAGA